MRAPSDTELLAQAYKAAEKAYAPYSEFPVGAALLLDDNRVITGCNVENASYGLTMCAERNACGRMIIEQPFPASDITQRPRIKAVAIAGLKAEPCYPCGACRQILHEFGCERAIVSIDNTAHTVQFNELLPHAFGPEDL